MTFDANTKSNVDVFFAFLEGLLQTFTKVQSGVAAATTSRGKGLARKNHAKSETTSSSRARRPLSRRFASVFVLTSKA